MTFTHTHTHLENKAQVFNLNSDLQNNLLSYNLIE